MISFGSAPGRLLIEPPQSPAWNMAVDEVLLENAASDGALCLRFYGWDQPTVSLGYFQEFEQRRTHRASVDCPLVRRTSGGGAIVHDRPEHDLTYAIAVPAVPRRSEVQQALYRLLHEQLVSLLARQSVTAEICTSAQANLNRGFLCFLRHTPGDVLISGHKIGGSAQRRYREAVLQHGSVLLSQSSAAPELPGLRQLTGQSFDWSRLVALWSDALATWADGPFRWESDSLTRGERERAAVKVRQKFASDAWNRRR